MARKEKRGGFDRYVDGVFKRDHNLKLDYWAELLHEPISTQITVLRHWLGLTQGTLEGACDSKQPRVARLERKGENPTAKIVDRAAKAPGYRALLVPEKDINSFTSAEP